MDHTNNYAIFKQGLTGYYHKFIPAYADFVWPLIQLTHKTVHFIWTD